ncbi:MAG: hypothetical protein C0407_15940, partial [Desulfobacca sp.]|nr:hypothetical protein [Desulfobacca sp.]
WWVLQRVSALGLLILLGIHFWLLHYRDPGVVITFGSVELRLRNVSFVLVDLGLLTFGLFHALNGIQAIAQDYGFGTGRRKGIGWLLIAVGLVMTFLGGIALLSLL